MSSPLSPTSHHRHVLPHPPCSVPWHDHIVLLLQVGIASGDRLSWYGCDPAGGTMYVAGYFGSLQCPVATTFCSAETTTGILFTEVDPTLEWVLYGLMGGVVLILIIVGMACCKKIDARLHLCCGINRDGAMFEKFLARRHGRCSPAGWLLTVVSVLWLLIGLALVAFCIYTLAPETELLWDTQSRQVPAMAAVAVIIIVLASVGIRGVWKRVPSIALVVYFYVTLLIVLVVLFFVLLPVALSGLFEQLVEAVWPSVKSSFPDSWQGCNSTTVLVKLEQMVLDNLALVLGVSIFTLFSLLVGVICSFLNLTVHVVTRNFSMIMNLVFICLGGFLIFTAQDLLGSLSFQILVVAMFAACFLTLTGCVGTLAACQKKETFFKAYAGFAVVNLVGLLICGVLMLVYGDYFSHPAVSVESTLCSTVYFNSTACICRSHDECPQPVCVTSNETCSSLKATVEAQAEHFNIRDFDVCSMQTLDLPGDGGGGAVSATANATTTTTAALTHSFSAYLTCNSTSSFTFWPAPYSLDGAVAPHLNSLNLTELVYLQARFQAQTYDDFEEALEAYDQEQLLALAEFGAILFALLLLVSAFFQLMLLVTNHLIIKWNSANNNPHGKDTFWKKIHRAMAIRQTRSKFSSVVAFKKAGAGELGFREVKVSPEELDHVKTFTVKLKLHPEAFGEGVWGLGISFAERQLEDENAQGRTIVEYVVVVVCCCSFCCCCRRRCRRRRRHRRCRRRWCCFCGTDTHVCGVSCQSVSCVVRVS
jgi:hypothetical protein